MFNQNDFDRIFKQPAPAQGDKPQQGGSKP